MDFNNAVYIVNDDGKEIKQIKQGTTVLWKKPYVWAKYNLATSLEWGTKLVTTYGSMDYLETDDNKGYFYQSYYIEDGEFYDEGEGFQLKPTPQKIDQYSAKNGYYDDGYVYYCDGKYLYEITSFISYARGYSDLSDYENSVFWTIKKYKAVQKETYTKGSYIGLVSSSSSGTYPNDGKSGSYWYVLISSPNTSGFNPPVSTSSYSVENVPGATYGFEPTSEEGYYKSTNEGINSSYSICKVNINSNGEDELVISCRSAGEAYCDFGILSNLDTELTLSSDADTSNVCHSSADYNGIEMGISYGVPPAGNHFIYIKYRKDISVHTAPDNFIFKVIFE